MATTQTNERKAAATKRSTAAKKAAGTRAQNQARKSARTQARAARTQARRTTRSAQRSASRTATTAEREATRQANQAENLFERGALIYVGAALTARDRVVQGYEYLRNTYGDSDSVTRQLKQFERRGVTGRNRFERQVKRTRTQFERELRQRRNQVRKQVKPLAAQADLVSAQVENVVQTGVTEAQKAMERVVA